MKHLKRWTLFIAMALLLTACAPVQQPTPTPDATPDAATTPVAGAYTPGVYTAESQGMNGPVSVEVTFSADAITDVKVLAHKETEGIGNTPIERIPAAIVAQQSLNIDVVSGATMTSNAILNAVAECVTKAGGDDKALKAKQGDAQGAKETQKLSADVVVAGAGGAGLSAAVTAAQGGKSVILLEKMAVAGGATATAGGGTSATGSKAQLDAGITDDTPEKYAEDIARNGHNKNDPAVTLLFTSTVGRMFDWITSPEGAGVEYDFSEVPTPMGGHSVGRMFSSVGGGGAVVKTLLEKAQALGVQVLMETPATELMMDGNKVVGIKAMAADNTPYEITAGSVILATGGYGANTDMLSDEIKALPYAGVVSATGDGLRMAQAIGADVFDLSLVNIQPHSIKLPNGRGQHTFQGCLAMYYGTGSILVSDQGERFVNEQATANDIIAGMKQNKRSFLVMDDASFKVYTDTCIESFNYTREQLDEWIANNGSSDPVFVTAPTLEEAAAIVGMPGDKLKAQVEKYNGFVASGTDADFGRRLAGPMGEGPYHLVEMHLRYYATLGGLKINDKMQAVKADGAAIEGLYAAGELVGGVFGDIYIPSGTFAWALTSGHNAGLEVVK